MSTFLPFGTGRHSCIGMKLAYAEMRVTLARLLFNFDISLANQSDRWDWGDQKTYILWVSFRSSEPNAPNLPIGEASSASNFEAKYRPID